MKPVIPVSLRKWEERATATRVADALLMADRRRERRMAINNEGGGTAPTPINKRQGGAFDALARHPLYRGPRLGPSRRP
jgi:hypothetical protein